MRELKQPREENVKLKHLVADLSPYKVMLQDVSQKSTEARQEARVGQLLDGRYGMGNRQACRCCTGRCTSTAVGWILCRHCANACVSSLTHAYASAIAASTYS